MQDDELATQTFCKRSKSGGPSASQRQKMRRVSVGEGMLEMADALRQMSDAMRSRLGSKAPPESPKLNTDDPLTIAITILQNFGGLQTTK